MVFPALVAGLGLTFGLALSLAFSLARTLGLSLGFSVRPSLGLTQTLASCMPKLSH